MQSGKAQFFFPFSYCHRDSRVSLEPWASQAHGWELCPRSRPLYWGVSLPHSYFLSPDALPAVRWSVKAF